MYKGVHRYTNSPRENRVYIFCEIVDRSDFESLTRNQEEGSFDEPQTDDIEVILKGTYTAGSPVVRAFQDLFIWSANKKRWLQCYHVPIYGYGTNRKRLVLAHKTKNYDFNIGAQFLDVRESTITLNAYEWWVKDTNRRIAEKIQKTRISTLKSSQGQRLPRLPDATWSTIKGYML